MSQPTFGFDDSTDGERQPPQQLPPWSRNAPDTSREAAISMIPHFSRIAQDVARFVIERGPSGATTDEIERALGLSHQTASARVWELGGKNLKAGRPALIAPAGFKRPTRSGRGADVMVATCFLAEAQEK